MKKFLLVSLLLLSIPVAGMAQNASQARKVLDKTAAIVGRKSGASASFKIASSKYNTSGTLAIKGNKFYANTPKATIWYNGKTQWSYMSSTNEVNVSTPSQAKQLSMNPYVFINLYRSGYGMGVKTVGNSYQVHLTATDGSRTIKELYITVNRKSYIPSQVKMKQDGAWTTINISNFTTKSISDGIFTFNSKDYPSAEVIDLR